MYECISYNVGLQPTHNINNTNLLFNGNIMPCGLLKVVNPDCLFKKKALPIIQYCYFTL